VALIRFNVPTKKQTRKRIPPPANNQTTRNATEPKNKPTTTNHMCKTVKIGKSFDPLGFEPGTSEKSIENPICPLHY
jgi:hypothetical protein